MEIWFLCSYFTHNQFKQISDDVLFISPDVTQFLKLGQGKESAQSYLIVTHFCGTCSFSDFCYCTKKTTKFKTHKKYSGTLILMKPHITTVITSPFEGVPGIKP